MITTLNIPKGATKEGSKVFRLGNEGGYDQFPILFIGKDSFIVSSKCEAASEFKDLVYNLHVGKYCAIANEVDFIIDLNHDYKRVYVGSVGFIKDERKRIPRKGQILIQNDVWIGKGATLMGGVTIHNGAVVAANSTVTKDVAPYSIVGGNPARHIKYRFDKEIVNKLLEIQWWYWPDETIIQNADWFTKDIDEFVDRFYIEPEPHGKCLDIVRKPVQYLYFPDIYEKYTTAEKVIKSYVDKFGGRSDHGLILFIKIDESMNDSLREQIKTMLTIKDAECDIHVHFGNNEDVEAVFRSVDHYITNRTLDTVYHSCLADKNNVAMISGVDIPIFR